MSRVLVTIAEQAPEWVDGGVPFVESFTSRREAWIGAKHADTADPGDVLSVRLGDKTGDALSREAFVAWLREQRSVT